MTVARKSLFQLFLPICFETLFYMLAGMIDTLMLSSLNDQAVGAVGTSNTYISMFILMFSVVSTGMMAVMTQNIGASKPGVAYQAKNIGLIFNLCIGCILSIFLFTCSGALLDTIGISAALREPAGIYMRIVGGGCFLNALIPIFSGYLRSFGYTKQPLFATITGNIVNLCLNSLFLFYFHYGVAGVATATVISKAVNLSIVVVLSVLYVKAKKSPERARNKDVFLQIMQVGIPSATETLLYNLAMTLCIRFLNQMDSQGFNVSARAYAVQIVNFSFVVGLALAQANAIIVGWQVGNKEYDECMRGTRKAWKIGLLVSFCFSCVIALISRFIIPIFTDDPLMIDIVIKLIYVDIILEMGRVTNLVYGSALKTCGDAFFPVAIGVVFMFLCAVLGTYILGIRLGMLVMGCYIGLTLDEVCRGVLMIVRWKSGKWKNKALV